MPDETKPEQKSPALEPPKDIEDLLKELPKVAPQTAPPSPRASADTTKPIQPPSLPPQKPPMLLPPSGGPIPKPILNSPKPMPPPPSSTATPPDPNKFKSLVRTMEEDLEAVKKGMKPEPKPFEIKPPPGGPKIAPPPPPLKIPSMPSPIRLGPAEKTKPMEMPGQRPPLPPVGLPLPKRRFFFQEYLTPKLIIIVLIIAAVFAGIWYFMTRQPQEIVIPVQTATPTPTPVPKTLSELIPSSSQITIPSAGNFLTNLNNELKTSASTIGRWTILNLINENGNSYSVNQIFEKLNISPPSGLLENLDQGEWAIVAYGQQEAFDSKGLLSFNSEPEQKIGLIAKIINPGFLRSALNNWEITMNEDLKNLFAIDPKKSTSQTFLDNVYAGTDIRYRNFSYADKAIDYGIVNLPQFNSDYFILTNSRESMYSAIDLLRTQ